MIVLNLSCEKQHRFEGWFASSHEFANQTERRLVSCPVCGSHEITKLPSNPKIRRAAPETPSPSKPIGPAASEAGAQSMAMVMLEQLMQNSEDVGERFSEEARRIHREEAPARSIRGVASREEAQALLDEGIVVVRLPVPPKTEMH